MMKVVAWNYNPKPGTIKRLVEVGFRYPWRPENDLPNATWDWDNVKIGWRVGDDLNALPEDAAIAAADCGVLAFANLFYWDTFAPAPIVPPAFNRQSVLAHHAGVSKILKDLLAELSRDRVAKLNLVFDIEHWTKSAAPAEPGYSPPAIAAGCYIITESLRRCGWPRDPRAGWANFGCSHSHKSHRCGTNNRVTPNALPHSLDGETAYPISYTGEHMAEVEMLDAIVKCDAPVWLALHQQTPGLQNIIRAAKASGKVKLITMWVGTPGSAPHDPAIDQMIADTLAE